VLVALATVSAAVAQAVTWTTVAKKSFSGFNATAFSRTINHPHGIRLWVSHNNGGSNAQWTIACSKGFGGHLPATEALERITMKFTIGHVTDKSSL
jgi:hypothetical protein